MKRVLLLLLCAGCTHPKEAKEEARPVAVHCAKPTKESVEDTITLRGRITPPPGGELLVASQVPGRLLTVVAKEGDRLAAGDIVATVDEASTRDAARQADAALAQARAADVNAAAALERTRALVVRGIAAKQELEDATAKAAAAKEGVTAASAASDLAQRTLGRVQVRAGLAGLVTHVFRGPGAIVDGTAATPVVQLAATATTELVADVTQHELLAIEEGQTVTGTLAGEAKITLTGVVRSRPRALDPATGFGVVRITLTAPVALPVGAFARVVLALGKHDAMVIPATALRGATSDGVSLALCQGDKAALKTVTVGHQDETRVEVIGLGPDDLVALDHVLALDDGTAIEQAK